MIFLKKVYLSTKKGEVGFFPITADVRLAIRESNATEGLATVFVPNSGAGLITLPPIEGMKKELLKYIDALPGKGLQHQNKKKENVEFFPLIAQAIFGSSCALPFAEGNLILAQSNELFLVNFDREAKRRELAIQIFAEVAKDGNEAPQGEEGYY